jgi:cullin-associated NEDD8-dissociated protein 1
LSHVSIELHTLIASLWELLFQLADGIQETGTRAVIGDSIGKLVLFNPEMYLPILQKEFVSSNHNSRFIAISAFRYIVSKSTCNLFDTLAPFLLLFLQSIGDVDVQVRKMGLSTAYTCLHSKPELIFDVIPTLVPLLYKETEFKVIIYLS